MLSDLRRWAERRRSEGDSPVAMLTKLGPHAGHAIYRRLGLSVHPRMVRAQEGRFAQFLAHYASDHPLYFVVVPRTLHFVESCLRLIPNDMQVILIENGIDADESARLALTFPRLPRISVRALPGQLVQHGTLLTSLVRTAPGPFFVLDHDCFVFEPSVFSALHLSSGELLGAPDVPGFVDVHAKSGLKYPRTHLLSLDPAPLRSLMDRHSVHLDKYRSTPAQVRDLVGTVEVTDRAFPRDYQKHYDTLLLALSIAYAEKRPIKLVPVPPAALHHVGGTSWVRHHFMDFVHLRFLELTQNPDWHARRLKLRGTSADARAKLPKDVQASKLVTEVDVIANRLRERLGISS